MVIRWEYINIYSSREFKIRFLQYTYIIKEMKCFFCPVKMKYRVSRETGQLWDELEIVFLSLDKRIYAANCFNNQRRPKSLSTVKLYICSSIEFNRNILIKYLIFCRALSSLMDILYCSMRGKHYFIFIYLYLLVEKYKHYLFEIKMEE